jgi:hypothetical protein
MNVGDIVERSAQERPDAVPCLPSGANAAPPKALRPALAGPDVAAGGGPARGPACG